MEKNKDNKDWIAYLKSMSPEERKRTELLVKLRMETKYITRPVAFNYKKKKVKRVEREVIDYYNSDERTLVTRKRIAYINVK